MNANKKIGKHINNKATIIIFKKYESHWKMYHRITHNRLYFYPNLLHLPCRKPSQEIFFNNKLACIYSQKKINVFFLGLLSTPFPYILLAAFYFFGFAMGMFNNSIDKETIEHTAAITIPVEINNKITDHSTFYFQLNTENDQIQCKFIKPQTGTSDLFPDTNNIVKRIQNIKIQSILFYGFHFSRPPPTYC